MSSSSIAIELVTRSQQYSLYTTSIILIIGLIGNILNIIVFLNLRIFRNNQCAFYLIVESFVNIIQLIFLFLVRALIKFNNGIDPANESLLWCKLRTMIGQSISLLSFSIVCFAAYDQFLATSHRFSLRQMSTYKLAQSLTLAALCLYSIHSIPFGIFLNIQPSYGCAIFNRVLNRYYQFFYYPILAGILPVLVSSFFSLLAFRNVRRLVRRQVPIVRRRLDRQFTAMILSRTPVFIVLVLPYSIHRIYWLELDLSNAGSIRYGIDLLIQSVIFSLLNLNFALNFYIFLISSSRFRHQAKCVLIKKVWRRWIRWCHSRTNRVTPSVAITSNLSAALE